MLRHIQDPDPRTIQYISRILWFIGLLILIRCLIGVYYTADMWSRMLIYPFDLDYGEGTILSEIFSLASHQSLYPVDQSSKFVASNYPPIYYLVSWLLLEILPNSQAPFLAIRLASVIGMVLLLIASFIFVFRRTSSWVAGTITAFLLLYSMEYSIPFINFGAYGKPDALAVSLSAIGLVLALINLHSTKLLWSVPFFVLALFTKQTTLPAPIALFLFLLITDRKRAFSFILLSITLSVFLLGIFLIVFGTSGFWLHVVEYNMIQASDPFKPYWFHPLLFIKVMMIPLILALFGWLISKNQVLALYFCLAFLLYIPALYKEGASYNYWMEPFLALVLIIGEALGLVFRSWNSHHKGLVFLFIVVFTSFIFSQNPKYGKNVWLTKEHFASADTTRNSLKKMLAQTSKEYPLVFAARPGTFTQFLPKIDILIDDPFLYNQMQAANRLGSNDLFVNQITAKKLDFIALNYKPEKIKQYLHEESRYHHITRVNQIQATAIQKYYVKHKEFWVPLEIGGQPEPIFIYIPRK